MLARQGRHGGKVNNFDYDVKTSSIPNPPKVPQAHPTPKNPNQKAKDRERVKRGKQSNKSKHLKPRNISNKEHDFKSMMKTKGEDDRKKRG